MSRGRRDAWQSDGVSVDAGTWTREHVHIQQRQQVRVHNTLIVFIYALYSLRGYYIQKETVSSSDPEGFI